MWTVPNKSLTLPKSWQSRCTSMRTLPPRPKRAPHKLLALEDPTPTGRIQAADAVLERLLQHHDVVAEAVDHVLKRSCSS